MYIFLNIIVVAVALFIAFLVGAVVAHSTLIRMGKFTYQGRLYRVSEVTSAKAGVAGKVSSAEDELQPVIERIFNSGRLDASIGRAIMRNERRRMS